MLEFLGDALGAIVSGGATGLLGAALSTFGELAKMKTMNAHKEAMADKERETLRMEAELEIRKVQTEGEIQAMIEEGKTMAASYAHDKASYISQATGPFSRLFFGAVDVFRGLIRPAATVYLVAVTSWILVELLELMGGIGGAMTTEQAYELINQIVIVVLYLTATTVLWWFGTRQKIVPATK